MHNYCTISDTFTLRHFKSIISTAATHNSFTASEGRPEHGSFSRD